jgi:hypothetical protein
MISVKNSVNAKLFFIEISNENVLGDIGQKW